MYVKIITKKAKAQKEKGENKVYWAPKSEQIIECRSFCILEPREKDDLRKIFINSCFGESGDRHSMTIQPTVVKLSEHTYVTEIFIENNNGDTIGRY